jgi:hypothetical protein
MFSEYVQHGWKLCAINRGKKAPTTPQWNTRPVPLEAADGLDGAGLLHVLSGTCAIDLDNLTAARAWLAERGVDIDALLEADDAVQITSGRPNRAKLLYRMKRPLRSFKPKGSGLELRCATAEGKSVQDVLPPSIHPDTGKLYAWAGGLLSDWQALPAIPANLLNVWREMTDGDASPDKVESVKTPVFDRPDLIKLRKATFNHSPDAEHDEWLKVGMQLNDATKGAQEGLDLWCEWSRGVKRIPYPGDAALKVRWLSFGSAPGKHVASGAALAAELPAEADEFPIVDEETEAKLKEINRARDMAAIEKLEARLVFVHSVEKYFDVERHKIIGSDNAIEHMFTGWMPKKKGGRASPVKLLKASTTKRFVDAIGFHPGEGVLFQHGTDSFANTYRNRMPEPLSPTSSELEKILWLFNRIDDPLYREWLQQFYGHVIQQPGTKIKAAPLIWSETQGNGKTTILKTIPALLVGEWYSKEVTFGLLNSDFNDYLLNAWHVNLTEFRAGTRGEREAISKKVENWIADDSLSIHPKGMAGYTMPNHIFVTATSNKDDAASIDNNDRKWAVHELKAPQFTESEQGWIYNDFLLLPRAAGVLRHYFLNIALDGFQASARAPETAARTEMVEASITSDMELLQCAFDQCSEPLEKDIVLVNEVMEYVHRHCPSKPSMSRIGKILARRFNGTADRFRAGKSLYSAVIIRNHVRWEGASGKDKLDHISGNDVDLMN